MLEILVTMAVLVILMAKRPKRRRRMGKYIRGNVDETLNLGTLAAVTLVGAAFDESVNERTYVSSVKAIYTLDLVTAAAGVGPLMVGVAHSDYSDAEIEEWIENAGSWNEGDLVNSLEIGKRRCRRVGVFDPSGEVTTAATIALNEGRMITTKLGWTLLQGQSLRQWAYNMGTVAYGTTNPSFRMQGHVNLWPR